MPRTHRPYLPEFRAEAVRLARGSERSVPALDLGVSSEALRHWLRQDDADAGRGQPSELTTEEREELRRVCREVKTLQQEREILRNGPEPWHTLPDEDGGILVATVGMRGCRFSVPLSPREI
jgi:transposase